MACGVCARSTRRAASLPGEGSTHLRGCGMTAVGTFAKCPLALKSSAYRGRPEVVGAWSNDEIDPGCVKTPTSNLHVEILSRLV
jgi:hypothetical protein